MIKRAILTAFFLLTCASAAMSQDTVTISREAAVKCLRDADRVAALEAEIKAKDQAIADLREVINALKVEVAKMSGEKTQLEATLVRYNAIMDILIKNSRPKKIGLINLF